MAFKDDYTTDINDKDKKVISQDAYAIGDMIQSLIDKIEHARLSFK